MTTLDKLIQLTKDEKIRWYQSSETLFKTVNNDICIRLEVDDCAGFALKIDTQYYSTTAEETYESDKLILLYKEIMPRSQRTAEDLFFEGLI